MQSPLNKIKQKINKIQTKNGNKTHEDKKCKKTETKETKTKNYWIKVI